MNDFATKLGALSALVVGGMAVNVVQPEINITKTPQGLNVQDTHAAGSLLGQFRTGIAGWLWLRTDLYLHNGVQMRPRTKAEQNSGKDHGSVSTDNADGALHDDTAITTVIPAAEDDFRGIFGDVERAVSAYKDMHNHTHNDPHRALPLFRLMTWSDPQFLPGWTTGAHIITRKQTPEAYRDAVTFLLAGLEHNPGSIALLSEIGFIQAVRQEDLLAATHSLEAARQSARSNRNLSEDDRNEVINVYRMLALCYRDLGLLDQQYEVAREGVALFPEDVPLARYAEPNFLPATEAYRAKLLGHQGVLEQDDLKRAEHKDDELDHHYEDGHEHDHE